MSRHWKIPGPSQCEVVTTWNYVVQVCSFTFSFSSIEEVQEYLDYFRQKTHPSSASWAGNRWIYLNVGDHYDRQSRFDRLPIYLSEEPKRQKVIKALEKALAEFSG